MATYSVRIENIEQIRTAFRKAPALTTKELDLAIQKSVFSIEALSKQNTPVLTGYLRASHTTTFSPLKGVIEPTANYAIYVHEGTRFMAARPFLAEAVKSQTSTVNEFFKTAVENVFKKIAKDAS